MAKLKIVRNRRNNFELGVWKPRYKYLAFGPIEFRYYPDINYDLTTLDLEDERPYTPKTCPYCLEEMENPSLWAAFTDKGPQFICEDCAKNDSNFGPPFGYKVEQ